MAKQLHAQGDREKPEETAPGDESQKGLYEAAAEVLEELEGAGVDRHRAFSIALKVSAPIPLPSLATPLQKPLFVANIDTGVGSCYP